MFLLLLSSESRHLLYYNTMRISGLLIEMMLQSNVTIKINIYVYFFLFPFNLIKRFSDRILTNTKCFYTRILKTVKEKTVR